jgi:AAA domain/FaeA-like protein
MSNVSNQFPGDNNNCTPGDLFTVTHFLDKTARKKGERQYSLQSLMETIQAEEGAAKSVLPWLKFTRFGMKFSPDKSLRHDANALAITGVEGDYDGEEVSFDDAVHALREHGIACIVHTSPSHTPEKPRWRVLAPTSCELPPSERYALVARLNGALEGVLGPESFTLSQAYLYGHIDGCSEHREEVVDGSYIDLMPELDQIAIGKSGHQTNGNGATHDFIPMDEAEDRFSRGDVGDGHPTVAIIAGKYAREGRPIEHCQDRIMTLAANVPRYVEQKRMREFLKVIRDIYAKDARERAKVENPVIAPTIKLSPFSVLEGKTFMPLKWIIPRYIPEGVTLLAGKPKVGKSWLMLTTAMAVARGEVVLGEKCERRNVLYCALEDNERRMHERTSRLIDPGWPDNAWPLYEMPNVDQGGIAVLEQYLKEYPIDLVIIDTLAAIKGQKLRTEEPYQHDYRTMKALHDLGRKTGVSIIVVHHVRKATADDVFDTISGTNGLSGAADTLVVLTRTKTDELRFTVRGRDVEPEDKIIEFDSDMGEWNVTGDHEDEASVTPGAGDMILSQLATAKYSMKPADIAKALGLSAVTVRGTLRRLHKDGKVKRTEYKSYYL